MTASGCDTDFKNEREKQMKKAISILLFAALPFLVFSKDENLPHKTNDKNAPVVYFTRDVTSSGLMKSLQRIESESFRQSRNQSEFWSSRRRGLKSGTFARFGFKRGARRRLLRGLSSRKMWKRIRWWAVFQQRR